MLEALKKAGVPDPVALLAEYADAHPDDEAARVAAIEAILIEIADAPSPEHASEPA